MTTFLTAAELAAMRSEVEFTLPTTGAIYRRTMTSDSAGGFTVSEALVEADVACRIDPISDRDAVLQTYAEKIGNRPVWKLALYYTEDITEGDVLIIGDDTRYEVIGLLERSWEIVRWALIVRHD